MGVYVWGAVSLAVILCIVVIASRLKKTSTHQKKNMDTPSVPSSGKSQPLKRGVASPVDQMHFVQHGVFQTSPIMNKPEYALYRKLSRYFATHYRNDGYYIFPQVAMGSFIRSDDRNAHSSINSKRADFVVFDRRGYARIAIEYQGTGHYQGNAFMRDAIKREACRKAGIEYVEFKADYDDSDVNRLGEIITRITTRQAS